MWFKIIQIMLCDMRMLPWWYIPKAFLKLIFLRNILVSKIRLWAFNVFLTIFLSLSLIHRRFYTFSSIIKLLFCVHLNVILKFIVRLFQWPLYTTSGLLHSLYTLRLVFNNNFAHFSIVLKQQSRKHQSDKNCFVVWGATIINHWLNWSIEAGK